MERIIKRGDIYYAELNPVIGSEQGGTRPVLIISNDVGNKHSPTVIVAPITSRIHTKAKLPTHTLINDFEGLDKNSIILLEQVRTIDKQRLEQYLGMIPDDMVVTNHLCKFRISFYGDKILRILSVHRIPPFVTDRLFFDDYILSQVRTFFKRADFCGSPMRNKP